MTISSPSEMAGLLPPPNIDSIRLPVQDKFTENNKNFAVVNFEIINKNKKNYLFKTYDLYHIIINVLISTNLKHQINVNGLLSNFGKLCLPKIDIKIP